MTLIEVTCDLCGGDTFDLLYPNNVSEDNIDPSLYFSSSRTLASHLDIVSCRACNLVMTNPRDDPSTLHEVYHRLQDQIYEREETNRLKVAWSHLKTTLRHQSPPGRLLDVGCSTGIFINEAHHVGWQVSGIEPSQWAVKRALGRCPQAEIQPVKLEEARFPGAWFEVVTLWDVFEHISSPSQALRQIHHWLKPNGWLLLNVPNIASLPARLMGKHWVLLLREHLYYFTPDTMGAVLEKSGFRIVETRPNYVWFSIENIVKRLSQYPGSSGKLTAWLIKWEISRRFSVKFPIGEMIVAACKV